MSSKDKTLLEKKFISEATKQMGVFCCFEVTIGLGGKERVDYMTYNSNHIWRCYEIKVTLSDFKSSAAHTFVGHYNYYVMPIDLYENVLKKGLIEDGIGVYCSGVCVKKAKKRNLLIDENILKDSFIRSLYREAEKTSDSENLEKMNLLKKIEIQRDQELQDVNLEYRKFRKTCERLLGKEFYEKILFESFK